MAGAADSQVGGGCAMAREILGWIVILHRPILGRKGKAQGPSAANAGGTAFFAQDDKGFRLFSLTEKQVATSLRSSQ